MYICFYWSKLSKLRTVKPLRNPRLTHLRPPTRGSGKSPQEGVDAPMVTQRRVGGCIGVFFTNLPTPSPVTHRTAWGLIIVCTCGHLSCEVSSGCFLLNGVQTA